MTTYQDNVEDLFEQQGFAIEEPDDGPDIRARNETVLEIFCSTEPDSSLIDHVLEYAGTTENDVLLFTPEDLEDSLLEELEQHDVDHSRFDPFEDDQEIDTPENMPSSYEIIGDIAILNMDETPENIDTIAETITEQNPSVTTVLRKSGQLSGEYRVGDYEILLGDDTETVHTEHGCRYRVDPTVTYFSERLGHERERVIEEITPDEQVHIWFAGVGPYAVLAATETEARHIHAIEKNPAACEYLMENIELNNVEDRVTGHCGDVRKIAPTCDPPDRIAMPLPGSADAFLELAMDLINDDGIIHYYRFAPEEELWEKPEQEIEDAAETTGHDVTIEERTICGHYAPYIHRICIDIRVND